MNSWLYLVTSNESLLNALFVLVCDMMAACVLYNQFELRTYNILAHSINGAWMVTLLIVNDI